MSNHYATGPVRTRLLALADRGNFTLDELAAALHLPRRSLHRVLTGDRLRWDTADRVAVALGHHPSELWPDWFTGYNAKDQENRR